MKAQKTHPQFDLAKRVTNIPVAPNLPPINLTLDDWRAYPLITEQLEVETTNESNAIRQQLFRAAKHTAIVPTVDPFISKQLPSQNIIQLRVFEGLTRQTATYSAEHPGEPRQNNGFRMV